MNEYDEEDNHYRDTTPDKEYISRLTNGIVYILSFLKGDITKYIYGHGWTKYNMKEYIRKKLNNEIYLLNEILEDR